MYLCKTFLVPRNPCHHWQPLRRRLYLIYRQNARSQRLPQHQYTLAPGRTICDTHPAIDGSQVIFHCLITNPQSRRYLSVRQRYQT